MGSLVTSSRRGRKLTQSTTAHLQGGRGHLWAGLMSQRCPNARTRLGQDVDTKVHPKHLAAHVQQYITRTVHHGQMRFILGVQSWFNV